MSTTTQTTKARTRTKRTVNLSLSIKIPAGYDEKDVINYARDALASWCKEYHPDDSLANIGAGITIRHEGKVV
jgi:hypothetical protein